MNKLKLILYPISAIYGAVLRIRHWLYDAKVLKSNSFDLPIIKVGNLNLGGTGKTPHAEYLIGLLQKKHKIALLSRGYKRKTKDFQMAYNQATPETIGDESFQIFRKFPEIIVAVDKKRVQGVKKLMNEDVDVIVLDDALQHRALAGGLSIQLMDYNRPIYKDYLWPTGTLRDVRSRMKKMDVLIVSKCPHDLTKVEQFKIIQNLRPHSKQKIFFTNYVYQNIKPVFDKKHILNTPHKYDQILLFSGIARSYNLVEFVSRKTEKLTHLNFPDHHDYTSNDIYKLIKIFDSFAPGENILLTTEKDAVKLMTMSLPNEFKWLPIFYLPIEVDFLDRKQDFEGLIEDYVRKNKRDR